MRDRHVRGFSVLALVSTLALAACGGGDEEGGSGSGNGGPTPSTTAAATWEATLSSGNACYRPQQSLALSVRAWNQAGTQLQNPSYAVTGAVTPDGAGGYRINTEGNLQLVVTYTGERATGAAISPVTLNLLSDVTPPRITIDAPQRAAMLVSNSATTELSGSVVDATSPVDGLRVNGVEQPAAAPGALQRNIITNIPAKWGLNIIELDATDRCGNRAERVQSFLHSGNYLPPATTASATARVARAVTTRLSAEVIDDDNRNDLDDVATLVERYSRAHLSQLIAGALPSNVRLVTADPPSCPGFGFNLSTSGPLTISGFDVNNLSLQAGALTQSYTIRGVNVALAATPRTAGIFCNEVSLPTVSTSLSTNMTIAVRTTFAISATGSLVADSTVTSLGFSNTQLDLTGLAVIDDNIASVGQTAANSLGQNVANRLVDNLDDPLGSFLSDMVIPVLEAPSLAAVSGIDSISVTSAAMVQTFHSQIYPARTGTPFANRGSISRPIPDASLPATPPLTFSVNDNAINQGLWALWHGGWMELPDIIGLEGASARVSAMLPPVLEQVDSAGAAALGIGDLSVLLELQLGPLSLPPVTGRVVVDAFVSYRREGNVAFDPLFRRFRLTGGTDRTAIEVKSITDGNNVITDPAQLALIRSFATSALGKAVRNLAERSLTSSLLPASSFEFQIPGLVVGTTIANASRLVDRVAFEPQFGLQLQPTVPAGAYLALNEPWTTADLLERGIPRPFHEYLEHWPGTRPDDDFITVVDYRSRRQRCDDEGANESGSPFCLKEWEAPLKYGWFCGAGRPIARTDTDGDGILDSDGMSAPALDPVDYCCRIHDQNHFDTTFTAPLAAASPINSCGITMCLSKAKAWPHGIAAIMPGVEKARQAMYDQAAVLCSAGAQEEDPALPVFEAP